jgi:hypothetical protein
MAIMASRYSGTEVRSNSAAHSSTWRWHSSIVFSGTMFIEMVMWRRVVPRAFGALVSHLPSAILSLPAFVSRSPPDNSCMYPSWISRSLCSAGIVRCIKPLAQSRNETNSSWINGADNSGFIFRICASGAAVQARFVCHNQTDPLPLSLARDSKRPSLNKVGF